MNKEEAISVLNDYDINFERNTAEEVAEAHEMAIKALEEQPSEDWNAVLDELNRIGRNAFKDDTDYDNLFDFISNLPNVKPQPKADILDKIEAEIDRARFIDKDTRYCRNALASGLEVALQIIDKYKTESEE